MCVYRGTSASVMHECGWNVNGMQVIVSRPGSILANLWVKCVGSPVTEGIFGSFPSLQKFSV